LASILTRAGYEAAYIDSYLFSGLANKPFFTLLGFTKFLDTSQDPIVFERSSYATTVDKERQSFRRVFETIIEAEDRGRKALAVLATTIGHYPWAAKSGQEAQSNVDKVHGIGELFNVLLGEFLQALTDRGLANQVLIVVTGDHGLRYRLEFESLGEKVEHGDVAFNVPFLLYGPGLFDEQVPLPYVTSHVDITPTLLALNGIASDSWLHHGGNLLDENLRDRVTFMMNTRLSPVDGFHWGDCNYIFNNLTGQIRQRPSSGTANSDLLHPETCSQTIALLKDDQVRSILKRARKLFQATAAYFHQRRASS
jgi:phosphoglycerol transferase MdoB-like AlkP superfamily enzyme